MIGVDRSKLKPVAEVSVGAWIATRLGPFGGWVRSVAPRGYTAYAQVLHPPRLRHPGRDYLLFSGPLLAESALEAWPVDPDDSLAHDGDTLNT